MLARRAGLVGTVALATIGAVHTALTPFIFGPPSESAAWFAGSGLALIFSATINLVARRRALQDRLVWWLQQAVNASTVWIAGFVVSQLPEVMRFAVLGASLLQALGGFARGVARPHEAAA